MPASATIDLNELRVAADGACRLLKLLSNPDRLLLLCRLAQGEACVSELEEELQIVQPTLSQQLGVLRDDHMVATRRDGKHIYYRLASAQALAVISTLQAQFCPPSKPKKRSP